MTTYLRIASGVMLVLFLSWAGFQYNDPDALLWAAIYGIAALLTILFLLGNSPSSVSIAYASLCVLYAVYLAVRIILDGEFIFEERGREMLGLLICAGWITFLVSRSRSARPASTAV